MKFGTLCLWALGATFFVVIAGSIVRSAGAGMGCPDWPTCFGQWIPPTQESQLPHNYQEIYAHRGYANTIFNPLKTWLEYLNRLSGAVAGFLVLSLALSSLRFARSRTRITIWSFAALSLLVFQAWLGGQVVASNLTPHVITLHLLLALVLLALLIYIYALHRKEATIDLFRGPGALWWGGMTLLIFVQALFGAEVREFLQIREQGGASAWNAQGFAQIGAVFTVHRGLSLLIVLGAVLLALKSPDAHVARSLAGIVFLLLILGQVFSGIWMARFYQSGVPQAVHMILGSLAFTWACFLWLAGAPSKIKA